MGSIIKSDQNKNKIKKTKLKKLFLKVKFV